MSELNKFCEMLSRQNDSYRENQDRIERELGEPDDTVIISTDGHDITYGLWRVEDHVLVIERGLKRWNWEGRRYVQDRMIQAMERIRAKS